MKYVKLKYVKFKLKYVKLKLKYVKFKLKYVKLKYVECNLKYVKFNLKYVKLKLKLVNFKLNLVITFSGSEQTRKCVLSCHFIPNKMLYAVIFYDTQFYVGTYYNYWMINHLATVW